MGRTLLDILKDRDHLMLRKVQLNILCNKLNSSKKSNSRDTYYKLEDYYNEYLGRHQHNYHYIKNKVGCSLCTLFEICNFYRRKSTFRMFLSKKDKFILDKSLNIYLKVDIMRFCMMCISQRFLSTLCMKSHKQSKFLIY